MSPKNLLQLLLQEKFDFVLVGGYAGVVHGVSLVTEDLDICAVINDDRLHRLREILKPYHPVHRMTPQRISFLEHPQSAEKWNNIYLRTDLGQLDVLNEITGVGDLARLKQNAAWIDLYGHRCAVISIDDLIVAKKTVGREKDLLAVKELEVIRQRRKT